MKGDEKNLLALMKENSDTQEVLNEAMDEGILDIGDVDSRKLYVPYRPTDEDWGIVKTKFSPRKSYNLMVFW